MRWWMSIAMISLLGVGCPGQLGTCSADVDRKESAESGPENASEDDEDTGREESDRQGEWRVVGSAGLSDGRASWQSLAFAPADDLYVAYRDAAHDNKLTVQTFGDGTWSPLGTEGISEDWANKLSLAVSASGAPHVAYEDRSEPRSEGWSMTVQRYGDSSWETVGPRGLTEGQAYYPDVAFPPSSETPYIFHGDDTAVKKFRDGSWMSVGSDRMDGNAHYHEIAFAPASKTPYVAYEDWNDDSATTVRKFDGRQWTPVGDEGLSEGEADFQSLAFPPSSDTPYVAYRDKAHGSGATVQKFDGDAWGTVGDAGLSEGAVSHLSLAFPPSGETPYVAYRDEAHGSGTTVRKFDGDEWGTVGEPGLSAGAASHQSLAIHPETGEPYVAYSDEEHGEGTTVMRFATDGESE